MTALWVGLWWVHFWKKIYLGKKPITTYILPGLLLFWKKTYSSQRNHGTLHFCISASLFLYFSKCFLLGASKQLTSDLKKTNGGPKLISFGPKSVTCLTGARTDLLWSKGHKVSYEGPN